MTMEATATSPSTHAHPRQSLRSIRADEIEWRAFAAFPASAQLAVLVGDPAQAGLYVIRVRMPANVRMQPHRHTEDRIYTVISGVFYIGVGEVFDETGLAAFAPGSVVVLPAQTPHFHWARSGEYVTQVSAVGPLGLAYVDALDDPRNRT